MNKNEKFHDSMAPELTDDALESVAGGRGADENNFFGNPTAQINTVPVLLPNMVHPDAKQEEG